MPLEFALILISTMGTAVWTVLTWADQEEKKTKSNKEQINTLYINPFLLAAEELQSLIYRLLAEGEIEFLRSEMSQEDDVKDKINFHEALEIVYVFIKYFGWALYLYRYSSYTHDKKAIELTRNISEIFADRQTFGQDPFRYTPTTQRSLGSLFVRRLIHTNSPHPEFNSTPLYKFDKDITESRSQEDHLYQDISRTVAAIRTAKSTEDLPGRNRLIQVQNQLVDLLEYIESREGFSVASQKRNKLKLVDNKLTPYQDTSTPSSEWEKFIEWLPFSEEVLPFLPLIEQPKQSSNNPHIVHQTKGRIRIRIPQLLSNESYAQKLPSLIQPITGVESIQVNPQASSVTIYYNEQIAETELVNTLLAKIE